MNSAELSKFLKVRSEASNRYVDPITVSMVLTIYNTTSELTSIAAQCHQTHASHRMLTDSHDRSRADIPQFGRSHVQTSPQSRCHIRDCTVQNAGNPARDHALNENNNKKHYYMGNFYW